MGGLLSSRAFWLINFANFMDGIAYFGILTLLVPFLHADLQISDVWAGWCVSLFTFSVSLFMIVGGGFSDRLGVRRAIVATTLLVTVFRGLLTVAPSLPLPIGLRQAVAVTALLLMGACSGVNQPALYAGMKQYSPPNQSTMAYSLLYAIMNLGIVAAGIVSPFLRTKNKVPLLGYEGLDLGIQGVFAALVGISAISAVVLLVGFTRRVEEKEKQVLPGEADSPTEGASKDKPQSSWRDLPIFDPRFAFFIFALYPVRTLFAHQWLTLPDYVKRCLPDTWPYFEWVSEVINPAIVTIFTPLLSYLLMRRRVLDVMLVGTTLSAVSTFMVVSAPTQDRLITYIVLFSFGEAIWSSRFFEYVAALAPPDKVGSYMGMASVPWALAKFLTGWYSGSMLQRFVPEPPATVAAARQVSAALGFDPGLPANMHPETLWGIYASFACLTPVLLILFRPWLLRGVKRDATA